MVLFAPFHLDKRIPLRISGGDRISCPEQSALFPSQLKRTGYICDQATMESREGKEVGDVMTLLHRPSSTRRGGTAALTNIMHFRAHTCSTHVPSVGFDVYGVLLCVYPLR